jgi:hypothetical protein
MNKAKIFLLGLATMGIYSSGAILIYLTYGFVAYSAYNTEKFRLEQKYQKIIASIPTNKERRSHLTEEFDAKWANLKLAIDARRQSDLGPATRDYWRRMERAKRKRDSSDPLVQIAGMTDELRANNAWTTDSGPIVANYAAIEAQLLKKHQDVVTSTLENFDKKHPSDPLLVNREYPSDTLLPLLDRNELRDLLVLIGAGVLALYIAWASAQAMRNQTAR